MRRTTLTVCLAGAMLVTALAATAGAQHTNDPSTALLDPFDGATVGQAYGSVSYQESLPLLDQAVELQAGDWIKYSVPGWYQWPWNYDGTTQQGTVEAWVYPRNHQVAFGQLQWFNTASPPSSGYIGKLYLDADGYLRWYAWPAVGGPYPSDPRPVGSSVIPLEEWTHVAVTWSPSGTSLYVNGILDGYSTGNWYPALNSTFYVYLNNWGAWDLGLVDEFRISSVARSEEEIRAYVLEFINQPPVADDQQVTTLEDTPIDIELSGSDPDGSITEMTIETLPEHGTLDADLLPDPVTYTPDPDWNGTDSFTFTVGDGELTSDPATVTITVTPVNDPPVMGPLVDQTVQYSDGIIPIAVDATDIDSAALSFSATGLPAGLSLGSTTCVPDGDGSSCATTIEGAAAAPAGTYPATITVDDGDGLTDSESVTITVLAEDAVVSFPAPPDENLVAWQVDGDDDDVDLVSLTVLVEEALPDLVSTAGQTALPGDLSNVALDVELVPVGPGGSVPGTCSYAVDSGNYAGVLTATCSFSDVPVNTYMVSAATAGGLYTGFNEDVVVVFDPSLGFTTGGGWFHWPGTDDKTNFGFTMKYNKKGTNVKGSLLLIRHLDDGTKYRVKSNALYGLALGSNSDMGWASFSGKATYLEPGWDEPVGNHGFVVYVEDYGEPGAGSDRFWLETHYKNGDVIGDLSMDRDATDNATTITGGNIVAPH